MGLLDRLWDDVVAGPQPDHGLGKLRKLTTKPLQVSDGEASGSKNPMGMPDSPVTPLTPTTPLTPNSAKKENVWRSVFHPGSNLATKSIGAEMFDKPAQSNSPTVYDWLYSGESRNKYR